MRERILALVMCSVLAMTLFACGERRGTANDSDIPGDEQHYNTGTDNGTNNGTTNGSSNGTMNDSTRRSTTGNNAHDSDVMGDSAVRGSTINPANGTADRTATWEQMLENGRVHDRDGFLFDGENSHWL